MNRQKAVFSMEERMKTRARFLTDALLGVLFLVVLSSLVHAQEAIASVTRLYTANNAKNIGNWSLAELKKSFDPDVVTDVSKASRQNKDIGNTILYGASDISSLTDFKVGDETFYLDSARITHYQATATFKLNGEEKKIEFTLHPDGNWEIEDIFYSHLGLSLKDLLRGRKVPSVSAETSASSGFTPRTVTDFYLALPKNISEIGNSADLGSAFRTGFFFNMDAEKKAGPALEKYRRSLIKVEDTANGYLKIQGDGWSGWDEIALFKKTDGSYIVAISQVGDEPPLMGDVIFLSLGDGQWKNVTNDVFAPLPFSSTHYYKLPRTGATITTLCTPSKGFGCTPDAVLATHYWTKTRFTR